MNLFCVLFVVHIKGFPGHKAIPPIISPFPVTSVEGNFIPAAMVRKGKSEDQTSKSDQYIGYRVRVEVIMAASVP
jgi:hypothetical protein